MVIYPSLDGFAAVILNWMEALKAKSALKVSTINAKIKKISGNTDEEENTKVIGFASYDDEDNYLEEEDEDDDE